MASSLARAVRAQGGVWVQDATADAHARLTAGAVPVAALAGFARVASLVDSGWQAYLAVEPEVAAARLHEAERAAIALTALPGGAVVYADVCLRLGVVATQLGHADEASAWMQLAARLDPAREVSIAAFAPNVVSAYQAARGAAGTASVAVPVRLVVTEARPTAAVDGTDAAGAAELPAAVTLDGRAFGVAPRDAELAPGRHVLSAYVPGYRPHAVLIDVPAVAAEPSTPSSPSTPSTPITPITVELALTPTAAEQALLTQPDARPPAPTEGAAGEFARAAAAAVLTYSEIDTLVLIAAVWRQGQPALLGQRCQLRGALACTAVVELRYPAVGDLDGAVRELWQTLRVADNAPERPLLSVDARLITPEPAPARALGRDAAAQAPALSRRQWLWLGLGAAAVTATAGALWWLRRDADPPPQVSIDPCEFSACARF